MLDKFWILPFKIKNRILILAGIILVYVIYTVALAATIEAFQLNQELNKSAALSISQNNVNELKTQQKHIEKLLTSTEKDESILRKRILHLVATKSELFGVKIVQIPESHLHVRQDYKAIFNTFEIQGDFTELNKFLYSLEKESKDARIVSSNFQTKQNRVTKKKELTLTIYFQSIIVE